MVDIYFFVGDSCVRVIEVVVAVVVVWGERYDGKVLVRGRERERRLVSRWPVRSFSFFVCLFFVWREHE